MQNKPNLQKNSHKCFQNIDLQKHQALRMSEKNKIIGLGPSLPPKGAESKIRNTTYEKKTNPMYRFKHIFVSHCCIMTYGCLFINWVCFAYLIVARDPCPVTRGALFVNRDS